MSGKFQQIISQHHSQTKTFSKTDQHNKNLNIEEKDYELGEYKEYIELDEQDLVQNIAMDSLKPLAQQV